MSGTRGELSGSSDETTSLERADAVEGALVETPRSLRVVHIDDFEEAVALGADERDAYRRRFLTLFADESRERRGGLGRVTPVTNALGERFALKTLILPESAGEAEQEGEQEGEQEDPEALQDRRLREAFREEYACHKALSGFKGFPRLYGRGVVDGAPALVMEWVEGETLAHARRGLAVDEEGRVSPLTVARIGRDLFELVCRMDLVGEGYVHRDISPANVMVRTSAASVSEQADDGAFDLCLIDFGSSAPEAMDEGGDDSFTSARAVVRHATPSYAPPEMLSEDLPNLGRLRRQSAVDVYEAGSVLYELLCGAAPFKEALAEASSDGETVSPFRVKMDRAPARPVTVHGGSLHADELLPLEPEVGVVAGQAALSLEPEPAPEEVLAALALVDEQLVELVLTCLAPLQKDRPTAEAMREGLAAFCAHYAQNVGRALRGEPLIPCTEGGAWLESSSPFALRRMLRSVGTAVSAGLWLVVVVSSALLLSGAPASFALGDIAWEGRLSSLAVTAALAVPTLCGFVARGRSTGTRRGFLRGTVALAAATAVLAAMSTCLSLDPVERGTGVLSAICATAAAAWCPMVLDFATTVVPALMSEARRRLPAPRHDQLADAGARAGLDAPESGQSEPPAGAHPGLDASEDAPLTPTATLEVPDDAEHE